jgi:lysophospholipase L1-like esterase
MRYFRLIAISTIVFTALLVFPNRIPEFAGLWLVWCTFRLATRNSIRFELLAIPVWLMIKWPEPTWSTGIFLIVVLVVAAAFSNATKWKLPVGVLWLSWMLWIVQHHVGTHGFQKTANPMGPVVCLGDSLTDFGYPQELEKEISQPIADYGFNGYTTVDALKLVPEIAALKPHTVVIELGGHDFKNGESRSATADNLRQMIEAFQNSGAKVVLVEIPRGFINDPWYGFERQLAREYDLDLVPDTMIRRLIFWSPMIPPGSLVPPLQRLSDDGLHPNDLGNQMMAETVAGYVDEQ